MTEQTAGQVPGAIRTIAIVGAGAMGAMYAVHLADAGFEVSFVATGARAEHLRRDGIRVNGVTRSIPVIEPHHREPDLAAPCRPVDLLVVAVKADQLAGDFVAVVRWQGPRANGMPELHKLTPTLAALQDRGQRVALLTDGRMSGASGKVLAAIHVSPEAASGGALAKLRDGDRVRRLPMEMKEDEAEPEPVE